MNESFGRSQNLSPRILSSIMQLIRSLGTEKGLSKLEIFGPELLFGSHNFFKGHNLLGMKRGIADDKRRNAVEGNQRGYTIIHGHYGLSWLTTVKVGMNLSHELNKCRILGNNF